MKLILIILIATLAFFLYAAVGFVIGATLMKRRSASWRWFNSNIGEMVMSMSRIELVIYSYLWPIQLLIGVLLSIPTYINDWKRNKAYRKQVKENQDTSYYQGAPDSYKWNDRDFNSSYPHIIKDINKSSNSE